MKHSKTMVRRLSLLLALSLLLSVGALAGSPPSGGEAEAVPASAYYGDVTGEALAEAVDGLYDLGVIYGKQLPVNGADGVFAPEDSLTAVQLADLLARAAGVEPQEIEDTGMLGGMAASAPVTLQDAASAITSAAEAGLLPVALRQGTDPVDTLVFSQMLPEYWQETQTLTRGDGTLLLYQVLTANNSANVVPEDYDEVFAVVHTNDVHGYISVEPYVKAVADSLKARYGEQNVVTVTAGDIYAGGHAVAHLYKGELIPPVLDAAGYDLAVPGNNDFNMGTETMFALGNAGAHYITICANLWWADEAGNPTETVFAPSATFTTALGTEVGFFGLTVTGGPAAEGGNVTTGSVETAQKMAASLREAGCGLVIGIGHTGWNDDLVTPSSNDVTSAAIAQQTPELDAFIDGHTHSIIGGGGGWVCPETGVLVNQASCMGECVGVMTFYLKDGEVVKKTAELLQETILSYYSPDPAVQALVDADLQRLEEDTGKPIVDTAYFLNGRRTSESEDGRSIRTDETNLGDLVTDVIRQSTGADVGMMPGFRIRSSVSAGSITLGDLYNIFANGADIYVMEMTVQELVEKMAKSLIDLPAESTQFNQISGAAYGYCILGDGAFQIVDPTVGGEPLDPEKTYLVAMDAGGPDAPEDQEPAISGMEAMAEVMLNWLERGAYTIYPDTATPDQRIVPMTQDQIPADAAVYEVTVAMEMPPA